MPSEFIIKYKNSNLEGDYNFTTVSMFNSNRSPIPIEVVQFYILWLRYNNIEQVEPWMTSLQKKES